MKISIIDNYDSFVYNLVRYVNESISGEAIVMRNNEINYEILNQSDGILLSPGPGIPEEAGELMKVIDRFHTSKPILGVCLGHQAISEYFGGTLQQEEIPFHGKSSLIEVLTNATLFKDLDGQQSVGRYHSWTVSQELPKSLQKTAETKDGKLMALEHRSLPINGVQFHPESILTPQGRKIIQNWIKSI